MEIGVTNATRIGLDENLSRAGDGDVHLAEGEWLAKLFDHGGVHRSCHVKFSISVPCRFRTHTASVRFDASNSTVRTKRPSPESKRLSLIPPVKLHPDVEPAGKLTGGAHAPVSDGARPG
jgi:hypothetical protein